MIVGSASLAIPLPLPPSSNPRIMNSQLSLAIPQTFSLPRERYRFSRQLYPLRRSVEFAHRLAFETQIRIPGNFVSPIDMAVLIIGYSYRNRHSYRMLNHQSIFLATCPSFSATGQTRSYQIPEARVASILENSLRLGFPVRCVRLRYLIPIYLSHFRFH